ncbi:MAG: hypothetical protein GF344_06325 [Chitinivibrionales bacterium]|nr:hypothetical protein [Chitinivibrionales bacterium]
MRFDMRSILVFAVSLSWNCDGAEPVGVQSIDNPKDLVAEVIGKWALVKDIWLDSETGKADTTNYAPDTNIYVFEVRERDCVVYATTPEYHRTYSDTLTYSLSGGHALVTEGINDTLRIEITGNTMFVQYPDEDDEIIECIFQRYTGIFPPTEWPAVNNEGLIKLTAFYNYLFYFSAGMQEGD